MKRISLISFALVVIFIILTGCAGSGPIGGKGIPQSEKMTQHPQDDRALLYVNTEALKKSGRNSLSSRFRFIREKTTASVTSLWRIAR